MSVRCDYCGLDAELVDSAEVYNGRSYGLVWLCRFCEAWVGVHRGTATPLGRLANRELRRAKQKAHEAFDKSWRRGSLSRGEAYRALAWHMRLPSNQCHIGMFDKKKCEEVVRICSEQRWWYIHEDHDWDGPDGMYEFWWK